MGWVVGHSYICYGPLVYGATSVMYEGKPDRTPDASQYFRFEYFSIRAIKHEETFLIRKENFTYTIPPFKIKFFITQSSFVGL